MSIVYDSSKNPYDSIVTANVRIRTNGKKIGHSISGNFFICSISISFVCCILR